LNFPKESITVFSKPRRTVLDWVNFCRVIFVDTSIKWIFSLETRLKTYKKFGFKKLKADAFKSPLSQK